MHARSTRSTIAGYDSPDMRPALSDAEARRLLMIEAAITKTDKPRTLRRRSNLVAIAFAILTVALWTATAYVIASVLDVPQPPAQAEGTKQP